ncbi:MAG: 30S ribosomal protein S9 [Syntrophobacterales bacterium]|nr:30S ribosomal protein S9 [Syntrophobacterales bacterium]
MFFDRKNVTGQAGAIRHGISKALSEYDSKCIVESACVTIAGKFCTT